MDQPHYYFGYMSYLCCSIIYLPVTYSFGLTLQGIPGERGPKGQVGANGEQGIQGNQVCWIKMVVSVAGD